MPTDHSQAKSAKDLVALSDALLSPTNKEGGANAPKSNFRIKEDWTGLRIGFTEPTIWTSWRKSGRINADAERFMVCYFYIASSHPAGLQFAQIGRKHDGRKLRCAWTVLTRP
jgi:hypothetical protein